jgi:hypothetical protein
MVVRISWKIQFASDLDQTNVQKLQSPSTKENINTALTGYSATPVLKKGKQTYKIIIHIIITLEVSYMIDSHGDWHQASPAAQRMGHVCTSTQCSLPERMSRLNIMYAKKKTQWMEPNRAKYLMIKKIKMQYIWMYYHKKLKKLLSAGMTLYILLQLE